eukprot:TRINITY_DN23740_c0_g1_i2.p1 TRINITY_DN23740_c0_g1~~TRINITY_DN23740_c0_g1_i2.p1  ORF type:complete len:149 (+),score=3.18 TRINITY_DN23740_c0_g1_i2:159-605(+)
MCIRDRYMGAVCSCDRAQPSGVDSKCKFCGCSLSDDCFAKDICGQCLTPDSLHPQQAPHEILHPIALYSPALSLEQIAQISVTAPKFPLSSGAGQKLGEGPSDSSFKRFDRMDLGCLLKIVSLPFVQSQSKSGSSSVLSKQFLSLIHI